METDLTCFSVFTWGKNPVGNRAATQQKHYYLSVVYNYNQQFRDLGKPALFLNLKSQYIKDKH